MTISSEEFFANFHSIKGTTISERHKNLHLLINQIERDAQTGTIDINFATLQPRTTLEETFKVDILLRFRRIPDLVDILKSENSILISKVLKADWFYEELFNYITEDELIQNIFPHLSFNTKLKILNKISLLSRTTQQVDLLFNMVYEKYHFYVASKLLPSCSIDLMKRYLKEIRFEVTPKQLLKIAKAHPKELEEIFDILEQHNPKLSVSCKYKIVFVYLLQTDINLFLKLYEKYQPHLEAGWRVTDRLISTKKSIFLENQKQLYKILHKKQVLKSIKSDFEHFFINFLPKSMNQFHSNLYLYVTLLDKLQDSMKFKMLSKCFNKKYESDLLDEENIRAGILELMLTTEREDWMKVTPKPKYITIDSWICLMKTDESIPVFKKKISLTADIGDRSQLIGCMVESCRINQDTRALTEVCRYVFTKHRYDHSSVLLSFLNNLKNCFKIKFFDEEQWKYIMRIVQGISNRTDVMAHSYYTWYEQYLIFLCTNNLPMEDTVKELVKKSMFSPKSISINNPKAYKTFLLNFGLAIGNIDVEADVYTNICMSHIDCVVLWNRKHPTDLIAYETHNHAFNGFKKVIETSEWNRYHISTIIYNLLRTNLTDEQRADWLNLFFSSKQSFFDFDMVNYLITQKPHLLLNVLDKAVSCIIGMWYTLIQDSFWRNCRNYSHLDIPQRIVAFCLEVIKSDDDDAKKKNATNALSILMRPESFLELIEDYYPSVTKIDISTQDPNFYKMQQSITASLKNVIPPSLILDSILKFRKGDYLKFIQRSLHSVSHSASEKNLVPFLDSFKDTAVSIRKHAIYLTFKVLDKKEINSTLKTFMDSETNPSVRKLLFKGVFNYFSKNPNDYLWSLVKENLKAVDVEDSEVFEELVNVSKVPFSYINNYMVFSWQIVDDLPMSNNKTQEAKLALLNAITFRVVPVLDINFCLKIIEKFLFKSSELDDFQQEMYSFTCNFLLCSNAQEEHVNFIFDLFKKFIIESEQNSEEKTKKYSVVHKFITGLCQCLLENWALENGKVLKTFINLWNGFMKPHQSFHEYLKLRFTEILINYKVNKLTLKHLGENLANCIDNIFEIYGVLVSKLCHEELVLLFPYFLTGDDKDEDFELNSLILIENIVRFSRSVNSLLVAIFLLPENIPSIKTAKVLYNEVIALLEKSSDPSIQFSLYFYYTSCSVCGDLHKGEEFPEFEFKKSKPYPRLFCEQYTSKYRKYN